MTLHIQQVWDVMGKMPNGAFIRCASVFEDKQLIGRGVDLGGEGFRADFVNHDGEIEEIEVRDVYSALMCLSENYQGRRKRLN